MIDRRTMIASAAATLAAVPSRVSAEVSPLDYSWQQIAQSRFIVVGATSPPEGSKPGEGDNPFFDIRVLGVRPLKGTPPDPLVLRQPNVAPGFLNPLAPWTFAGEPALLFLADQEEEPPHVWLTHMESMVAPEPDVLDFVKREIAGQARYLAAWRPDREVRHYGQVKTIIDWLLAISPADPDAAALQAAGFERLESLGDAAATAMVMQMNDRRPLAVPRLSLGSGKGPNSRRRHEPQLMIDALAAMLEQVTGQRYGQPYAGGRESQRQLAYDGWRLYAGRHERGYP